MTEAELPLVSVVIVAHNNWPDLELAVESALNQSYRNLEIFVIDNGSTDATSDEIPRRYGHRLTYVQQENLYDAGGYNRGIRESSGEFVQLLDGDDFLAPNKIQKQVERFLDDPELDVVYGDVRQFLSKPGKPFWIDRDHMPAELLLTELTRPGGHAGLMTHSVLFRRAALERVGPWDESIFGADPDYWMRSLAAGCKFGFAPDGLSFYRRGAPLGANPDALLGRIEQTLLKARGYLPSSPHREHIEQRLASLWYSSAVLDKKRSRRESIERLRLARQTDPAQISLPLLALGYVAITFPGLRSLITQPSLARFRRSVSRNLGLLIKR